MVEHLHTHSKWIDSVVVYQFNIYICRTFYLQYVIKAGLANSTKMHCMNIVHWKRALTHTSMQPQNIRIHTAENALSHDKISKINRTICYVLILCVCMHACMHAHTERDAWRYYACTVPACSIASLLFTNIYQRICESMFVCVCKTLQAIRT